MKPKILLLLCLFLAGCASKRQEPCKQGRILYQSTVACHHEIDPLDSDEELTLEPMIDIALRNNPDTRKAWATARSAYAFHKQTLSDNYPEIDVVDDIKYTHISAETKGFSATNTLYNYNLIASYLLFDFGTRHYVHQSSRFAFYAARWNKDFTFQTVILEVIDRYTNYLRALETRKVREADRANAQISLDIGEAQYRAGIRTKADFLQVKSEHVNAEIQLEDAKGNVEVTLASLKNALGVTMNTPLRIAELPKDFSPQDLHLVVDTLIETGKSFRKDLWAICATAEQKKVDWKAASVLGWPELTGDWIYGRTYNAILKERNHNIGALSLRVPIFRGFFYEYNEKRAYQNFLAASSDYRNKELEVGLEVTTSYWNLKTSYRKYLRSVEYLSYSEEAYESTLQNYKAGVGGLQAVINSQDTLASARTQLVQDETDWILFLANLIFSAGILDENFSTATPWLNEGIIGGK